MSMNHVATYKKGEVIFVQGDPADCMYDIEAGSVGIFTDYDTKQEKQLTTLYEKQIFGEMGLIEGKPRSATAVALQDNTQLTVVSQETFAEYFRRQPVKVVRIMQGMSKRIRSLTEAYLEACSAITEAAEDKETAAGSPIRQKFNRYMQDYYAAQELVRMHPDLYYDVHMHHWMYM